MSWVPLYLPAMMVPKALSLEEVDPLAQTFEVREAVISFAGFETVRLTTRKVMDLNSAGFQYLVIPRDQFKALKAEQVHKALDGLEATIAIPVPTVPRGTSGLPQSTKDALEAMKDAVWAAHDKAETSEDVKAMGTDEPKRVSLMEQMTEFYKRRALRARQRGPLSADVPRETVEPQ